MTVRIYLSILFMLDACHENLTYGAHPNKYAQNNHNDNILSTDTADHPTENDTN